MILILLIVFVIMIAGVTHEKEPKILSVGKPIFSWTSPNNLGIVFKLFVILFSIIFHLPNFFEVGNLHILKSNYNKNFIESLRLLDVRIIDFSKVQEKDLFFLIITVIVVFVFVNTSYRGVITSTGFYYGYWFKPKVKFICWENIVCYDISICNGFYLFKIWLSPPCYSANITLRINNKNTVNKIRKALIDRATHYNELQNIKK